MKFEDVIELKPMDTVVYDPGYKPAELGFVTNVRKEWVNGKLKISVFVCYDGTGRGQLTPWLNLRRYS